MDKRPEPEKDFTPPMRGYVAAIVGGIAGLMIGLAITKDPGQTGPLVLGGIISAVLLNRAIPYFKKYD